MPTSRRSCTIRRTLAASRPSRSATSGTVSHSSTSRSRASGESFTRQEYASGNYTDAQFRHALFTPQSLSDTFEFCHTSHTRPHSFTFAPRGQPCRSTPPARPTGCAASPPGPRDAARCGRRDRDRAAPRTPTSATRSIRRHRQPHRGTHRDTVAAIARANALADAARIRIGQVLTIPTHRSAAPAAPAASHRPRRGLLHRVSGDTVGRIAARLRTSVAGDRRRQRPGLACADPDRPDADDPGRQGCRGAGTAATPRPRRPPALWPTRCGRATRSPGSPPPKGTTVATIVAANGLDSRRSSASARRSRSPCPSPRRRRRRRQHVRGPHVLRRRGRRRQRQPGDPARLGRALEGHHAGQDRRDGPGDGRRPRARAGGRVPGVRLQPAVVSPATPSAPCR